MAHRPRAPRINQSSLKDVTIVFENSGLNLSSIANLSASGLALHMRDLATADYNLASHFSATINFKNKAFPVNLILVRSEGQLLGFMFEKIDNAISALILSHFPFEIKGQKLIKVSNSSLKTDSAGDPHWYYDGRENELYFLLDEGSLVYFRISLTGKYIEKYIGYPMLVRRYNPVDVSKQKPGTRSVENLVDLNALDKENIAKFVNHIRNLDSRICQEIISCF